MKLVNENLENILTPKSEKEILESFKQYFKGSGFYGFIFDFGNNGKEFHFEPINTLDEFIDEVEALLETYEYFYDTFDIIKMDPNKPNIIHYYESSGFEYDRNAELIQSFKGE